MLNWQKIYRKKHAKGGLGPGAGFLQKKRLCSVPRPPTGGRNLAQETAFLWKGKGKALLAFSRFAEGFASAEATKGLSGRPLETFGVPLLRMGGATWNSFLMKGQGNPLPLYQYPKRANPLFPSRRAGKSLPLDAITFPFQRASVPPLPPEADPPRRTPERGHTPSRQLPQARASARTAAPPPR